MNKPSINSQGERKAGREQELGKVKHGHHGVHHFLMLTNSGLSHVSILKQLANQDSASVIRQLEAVFCGPLHELLTNNNRAFCSREIRAFAHEWEISLLLRYA